MSETAIAKGARYAMGKTATTVPCSSRRTITMMSKSAWMPVTERQASSRRSGEWETGKGDVLVSISTSVGTSPTWSRATAGQRKDGSFVY